MQQRLSSGVECARSSWEQGNSSRQKPAPDLRLVPTADSRESQQLQLPAAKALPVMAPVQAAQKQELKMKRIGCGVVCLLHPREIFLVPKVSFVSPGAHLFVLGPPLFPPAWRSCGHKMKLGAQKPREFASSAQGCPLKAAGGRTLRKLVGKGTKKGESVSFSAASQCRWAPSVPAPPT